MNGHVFHRRLGHDYPVVDAGAGLAGACGGEAILLGSPSGISETRAIEVKTCLHDIFIDIITS